MLASGGDLGDSLGVSSVTDPDGSRLGGETEFELVGSSAFGEGSGDGPWTRRFGTTIEDGAAVGLGAGGEAGLAVEAEAGVTVGAEVRPGAAGVTVAEELALVEPLNDCEATGGEKNPPPGKLVYSERGE